MPKSPEEMAAAMFANLEEKTGRTLAAWLELLKPMQEAKHGEMVKFLKTEHGLTHGYANTLVHYFREPGAFSHGRGDEAVEAQYSGGKSVLKPIYEKLTAAVQAFGSDVELSPKKAYVSFRRSKQFGLVKPATNSRIDVGIHLKTDSSSDRLRVEKAGSMTSHCVSLTTAEEVDGELIAWLREAYEKA
jgi:predicted transport protein